MGWYFLLFLLILLLIQVPVGVAMGLVTLIFFIAQNIQIGTLIQQTLGGADSFVLTAIPLFILAGELMNSGGITNRLVRFSNSLFGHLKGGLAIVTVATCMIFAGVSGSTIAEVAAVGAIMIPAMIKQGYHKEYAAAITGVASELGPIIPPSIPMILTANLAGVSVGRMFLGGAVPGVIFGILLMIIAYIIAAKRGYPVQKKVPFKEVIASFRDSIWALLMPVLMIGGIVGGVFTPTEAAGVAVLYGFIIGTFVYKELKLNELYKMTYNTLISTSTVMFVVAFANLYAFLLTREHIPEQAAGFLFSLSSNPVIVMLIIFAALTVLGMFMSSTPALMLSIPLMVPLVKAMHFDPVWFFVWATIVLLLGTLTPPVALSLYLTSSIAGVKPGKVFIEMLPFLGAMIAVMFLTAVFPPLITWLPNLVFGK